MNKYISTYFNSGNLFSVNNISVLEIVGKIVENISELCELLYLSTECSFYWLAILILYAKARSSLELNPLDGQLVLLQISVNFCFFSYLLELF